MPIFAKKTIFNFHTGIISGKNTKFRNNIRFRIQ